MTRSSNAAIPKSTAAYLATLPAGSLAKPSGIQHSLDVRSIGQAGDRLLEEVLTRKVLPNMHVCDMGCGYGKRALVSALKGAKVTAVDIHGPTLDKARKKIETAKELAGQPLRIELVQSDLFDQLADKKFDLITFFPPLVNEKKPASPNDPDFLRIIEDPGFTLIREFLTQARQYLNQRGSIILGYGLIDETEEGETHVYRGGRETLQKISAELGWQVTILSQDDKNNFAVYELRPTP